MSKRHGDWPYYNTNITHRGNGSEIKTSKNRFERHKRKAFANAGATVARKNLPSRFFDVIAPRKRSDGIAISFEDCVVDFFSLKTARKRFETFILDIYSNSVYALKHNSPTQFSLAHNVHIAFFSYS